MCVCVLAERGVAIEKVRDELWNLCILRQTATLEVRHLGQQLYRLESETDRRRETERARETERKYF